MPDERPDDDVATAAAAPAGGRSLGASEPPTRRGRTYRPGSWGRTARTAVVGAIALGAGWLLAASASSRAWVWLVLAALVLAALGAYVGMRVAAGRARRAGALVGEYRLDAVLGSGATSTVYLARDHQGRQVAVKVFYLLGAETAHERMARVSAEVAAVRAIGSAHLPQVLDVVDTPSATAVVMELVDGVTLSTLLVRRGALTPSQACAVLEGGLEGLADLHGAGLVHRDVKPDNIVVTPAGRSRLVDLGSVGEVRAAGSVVGSPAYASPEQSAGQAVDARSDVWSCGAVLFETMSGRRLASLPTTTGAASVVATEQLVGDGVPAALSELTGRTLAQQPEERPADAGELLAELRDRAGRTLGVDWRVSAGLGALAAAGGTRAVQAWVPPRTAPGHRTVDATPGRGALGAAVGGAAGLVVAAALSVPLLVAGSVAAAPQVAAGGTTSSVTSPALPNASSSPPVSSTSAAPTPSPAPARLDLAALVARPLLPGAGGGGSSPLLPPELSSVPAAVLHQDQVRQGGLVAGQSAFFTGFSGQRATLYLLQLGGVQQAGSWMAAARAAPLPRFTVPLAGAVGVVYRGTSWVQFVRGPVVVAVSVDGPDPGRRALLRLAAAEHSLLVSRVPAG